MVTLSPHVMKNLIVICFLLSTTAFSQQSSPANPCPANAISMSEMRGCADFEFEQADAHLNRVYEKVMRYMTDDLERAQKDGNRAQAVYAETGITNLKKAQGLWLSYRDAQCEAARQRYDGGTMAPLIYASCRKALTDHRIDDLKVTYAEEGSENLQ